MFTETPKRVMKSMRSESRKIKIDPPGLATGGRGIADEDKSSYIKLNKLHILHIIPKGRILKAA
jgi:hypothetical protein